jgi:hypothetical protein
MKIIAHRGNINGKSDFENNPDMILYAIDRGFDVEIDLRVWNNKLFLGHDEPQYEINYEFLNKNKNFLWIHCKNFDAIEFVNDTNLNYFWHQKDNYTITSKGYVWVYPKIKLPNNSICVMPELGYSGTINNCVGVCTDYPENWK